MEEFCRKYLRAGERLDNIGFGGMKLIQRPQEFCYGVDAVLLSDFAAGGGGRWEHEKRKHSGYKGDISIVDLGTGTGIIPLILSHKIPNATKIIGVEVQRASIERAERSIKLNGASKKISIIKGDVSDHGIPDILKKEAGCEGFDIVTTNPPYMEKGRGIAGVSSERMIARTETTGTLDDFIRTAAGLLKHRGDFYMVHRPSRLTDIISICLSYRIEPKAIRFVSPKITEEPNILLFHGVLAGGRELKIRKPLAVYDEKGMYTEEIDRIYERY